MVSVDMRASTSTCARSTEGGRVTQVGEGHETAADDAGPVMTFGAPTVGEILAERYQLEEHVNNDSAGRQVWRGIDVILRRPVAVVLRHPGGASATEMLQAAVDASRVIHPNLVGVYDAIDEGERAYVVREWVDGEALRELVNEEGPLDPARATAIAHSIADSLAAVHATGMVHGNVHPGTTLIGNDGRVVLSAPLIPAMRRSPVAGAILDGVNVASLALMAAVTVTLATQTLTDATAVTIAPVGHQPARRNAPTAITPNPQATASQRTPSIFAPVSPTSPVLLLTARQLFVSATGGCDGSGRSEL